MFKPKMHQALETTRASTTGSGDDLVRRPEEQSVPATGELPPIERPITDELLNEMGKALAARLNTLVANLRR
jgi:hypothetical protein